MALLILSYTALLDELMKGTVSDADLASAIFCLGCSPGWPFHPTAELLSQQRRMNKSAIKATQIDQARKAIRQAQEEGRLTWRRNLQNQERKASDVQAEISNMLERLHLSRLSPDLSPELDDDFLKAAIARANPTGLRIIV